MDEIESAWRAAEYQTLRLDEHHPGYFTMRCGGFGYVEFEPIAYNGEPFSLQTDEEYGEWLFGPPERRLELIEGVWHIVIEATGSPGLSSSSENPDQDAKRDVVPSP
jgi:hypothetical protein